MNADHAADRPGPAPLVDGTYDVLVVDAVEASADDPDPGTPPARVELVVTAGPAKGETVTINADVAALGVADAIDLLGLPATLTIVGGQPAVELD